VEDSTTALVFDHLSAESLRLAQKATRDYVPLTGEWQGKIGVFATDPGVRVVQGYTSDPALVRRAVERVLPAATAAADQNSERAEELVRRRAELRGQGASGAATGGASGPALGRAAAERGERDTELTLLQTELNLMRSFDQIDREHGGYDSARALLAVVQTLAYMPGRKAIVFFSEGLPVTPALSARLDIVINAANRANVTTYTVDANGLRAKSALTTMRKEMEAFADERRFQNDTGVTRTEGPITMAFERVEDTLRIDSRTGLARLAEDTGGFLIEQTNNLSSAFRRIDEDNRFHYLLTYSPKNALLDGKFREIRVNVRRSGLQVFARKGYRALPLRSAPDAGGYEARALELLDRTPFPNAFTVHAAGFSFPDPVRPGLTAVLVHLRTDALRFVVDPLESTYSAQAAIVVRIRDGQRRDVQKLSQQYVLAGAAKDVEAARNGEILFYRDADLAPGVYTVETIVLDAAANHASARLATLTVPAPERSGPAMSSLVLVKRVEEVQARTPGADAAGPLYVGDKLLYPNLGEPFRKSDTRELPFYFALYGDTHDAKASAQLLRNGQAVAEAPLDLPPAVASRIQHVGRLPIGSLATGTYELRIRIANPGGEVFRSAFFTLQD
jgi:VWFA-related protein